MTRLDLAQDKLEEFCRQSQVEFLGVFGSAARGEIRPDSDIDLLVRFGKNAEVSFFELAQIQDNLSRLLGRPVDLVTQSALKEYVAPYIYKDLKPLYGQP